MPRFTSEGLLGNKNAWKGEAAGRWAMHKRAAKHRKENCERCGALGQVVHHRDENPANNADDNFETLCRACHLLHHNPRGWTGGHPEGETLMAYKLSEKLRDLSVALGSAIYDAEHLEDELESANYALVAANDEADSLREERDDLAIALKEAGLA